MCGFFKFMYDRPANTPTFSLICLKKREKLGYSVKGTVELV